MTRRTLESGADRKLTLAFEALRLERGQRLLEATGFCAQR